MSGHLVIFEGIEGSGKSTQAKRLFDRLYKDHFNLAMTKEPGSSDVGVCVREMLLTPQQRLTSLSELFLFLVDRIQHIEEVLNPLLKEGKLVILDRFSLSTIAYQGASEDLDILQVRELEGMVRSRLTDCNVTQLLLDLPVEQSLERISGRNKDQIE